MILLRHRIQFRSQSFVPIDQRSENESSGGNHFEITKEITEFLLFGSLRSLSLHLWHAMARMPEMVAPRALVFRPLVKVNEALGTRLHRIRKYSDSPSISYISDSLRI